MFGNYFWVIKNAQLWRVCDDLSLPSIILQKWKAWKALWVHVDRLWMHKSAVQCLRFAQFASSFFACATLWRSLAHVLHQHWWICTSYASLHWHQSWCLRWIICLINDQWLMMNLHWSSRWSLINKPSSFLIDESSFIIVYDAFCMQNSVIYKEPSIVLLTKSPLKCFYTQAAPSLCHKQVFACVNGNHCQTVHIPANWKQWKLHTMRIPKCKCTCHVLPVLRWAT